MDYRNGELLGLVKDLKARVESLKADLKDCRNELCLYCGKYKERHNGACDGCRWNRREEDDGKD